jgi:transcription antitermination factor NusG
MQTNDGDLNRVYAAIMAERDAARRVSEAALEDPRRDWCLAYTEPHGEWRAAEGLMRRGFDVFVPNITHRKKHGNRRAVVRQLHIFPSYIFVGQPPGRFRFAEIEAAPGVVHLVLLAGVPVQLPQALLDEIAALLASGWFMIDKDGSWHCREPGTSPDARARYRPGGKVRVTTGPFASFIGIIAATPARERIDVLLDMFARKTPATLELRDVELVSGD